VDRRDVAVPCRGRTASVSRSRRGLYKSGGRKLERPRQIGLGVERGIPAYRNRTRVEASASARLRIETDSPHLAAALGIAPDDVRARTAENALRRLDLAASARSK
jgi:hypothetical protein